MQWGEVQERAVDLGNRRQVEAVRAFLARFELTFCDQVDYTVALYRDGQMIATGSLAGEVLRNIAVDEALQGEGLTASVLSCLMREAARRGVFHYFIYTRPGKARLFTAMGFREIARAEPYAALLESGLGSIETYLENVRRAASHLPPGRRAALVVNCNPFTLGHQAVIAKAAAENDGVLVWVVSEDQSVFPFADRIRLVRQGAAAFANVVVAEGGPYIISAATFPGYFTKGADTTTAQTRLDATVFASRIAPALGIGVRYVGEEPYCPVTREYNRALAEILPRYQIELRVMERICAAGGFISASRVREWIRQERWTEIAALVPETTYAYLRSPAAAPVLAKIRRTRSRH